MELLLKSDKRLYASLALAAALAAFSSPPVAASTNSFTPNLRLVSGAQSLLFRVKDVEPEIRVDTLGRIFVSAIHGVPGGTDLFEIFPNTGSATAKPTFAYRGMPDGLPIFTPTTGLAPGGGDTDLSIGSFNGAVSTTPSVCSPSQSKTTCQPGPLSITSLNLGTVYSSTTTDAGLTYTPGGNAAGAILGDDREWNNAFGGLERYTVVHDVASGNIQFTRSLDGGTTWVNGSPVNTGDLNTAGASVQNNELGTIVVDQNHSSGTPAVTSPILYEVFVSVASPSENIMGNINAVPFHTVYVGRSMDDGLTWTDVKVYNGPTTESYGHLFPSMAVDAAGNVYAVWSDDKNVFLAYSTDHGTTWRGQNRAIISGASTTDKPIQVTNSAKDGGFQTHIFPWIAAGFNGGVDIVYYETPGANPNITTNTWMVGMAQNVNVPSTPGTFRYYTPSDHIIHTGPVCENGIGCNSTQPGNRNLADDFQIAIDPKGLANITFTDDHEVKLRPQTYFTRQIYGFNIGTPNGGGPNQGCVLAGKTLPSGTQPGGLPLQLTVKKATGVSRAWLTLVVNRAVVASGYVTSYKATSSNSGYFAGSGSTGAFTATIGAGAATVNVAGRTIRGTVATGTYAL